MKPELINAGQGSIGGKNDAELNAKVELSWCFNQVYNPYQNAKYTLTRIDEFVSEGGKRWEGHCGAAVFMHLLESAVLYQLWGSTQA